jgi:hypothetical protein
VTETVAVLNRAADIIETCGLWKGEPWPYSADPYRTGQPCCTVAAIDIAAGRGDFDPENWDFNPELRLLDVIGQRSNIAGWSDAPERTADDVVAALRAAAELAGGAR